MNTSVQVARRGRRRSSAVSHNPRLSSVSNFWSRQNSYSTFATPSVGSLFDEVALNEEVARQERKFISSQKANARKRKKEHAPPEEQEAKMSSRTDVGDNDKDSEDGESGDSGSDDEVEIDPKLLARFKENKPIGLKHVLPKTKAPPELFRKPSRRAKSREVTTTATEAVKGAVLWGSSPSSPIPEVRRERQDDDENQFHNNNDTRTWPRRPAIVSEAILTSTPYVGPISRSAFSVSPIARSSPRRRLQPNSNHSSPEQNLQRGGGESHSPLSDNKKSKQVVSHSNHDEPPHVQNDQVMEQDNSLTPDNVVRIPELEPPEKRAKISNRLSMPQSHSSTTTTTSRKLSSRQVVSPSKPEGSLRPSSAAFNEYDQVHQENSQAPPNHTEVAVAGGTEESEPPELQLFPKKTGDRVTRSQTRSATTMTSNKISKQVTSHSKPEASNRKRTSSPRFNENDQVHQENSQVPPNHTHNTHNTRSRSGSATTTSTTKNKMSKQVTSHSRPEGSNRSKTSSAHFNENDQVDQENSQAPPYHNDVALTEATEEKESASETYDRVARTRSGSATTITTGNKLPKQVTSHHSKPKGSNRNRTSSARFNENDQVDQENSQAPPNRNNAAVTEGTEESESEPAEFPRLGKKTGDRVTRPRSRSRSASTTTTSTKISKQVTSHSKPERSSRKRTSSARFNENDQVDQENSQAPPNRNNVAVTEGTEESESEPAEFPRLGKKTGDRVTRSRSRSRSASTTTTSAEIPKQVTSHSKSEGSGRNGTSSTRFSDNNQEMGPEIPQMPDHVEGMETGIVEPPELPKNSSRTSSTRFSENNQEMGQEIPQMPDQVEGMGTGTIESEHELPKKSSRRVPGSKITKVVQPSSVKNSLRYVGSSVWGNYNMVKPDQFNEILNKTVPGHGLDLEQVAKLNLKTNHYLEDFFGKLCNDTDQCYGFFTFHHFKNLLVNQKLIDEKTTDIDFLRVMKNIIPRELWGKCEGIIYPDRHTKPEIGTDCYLWD